MATKKKAAPKKKAAVKKELNLPPRNNRRMIRNRLHKIRLGIDPMNDDLKAYMESQFQPGMTWNTFTFEWDVSPQDGLKLIVESQWEDEGGSYDPTTGGYYPTAFTRQK